MCIRDRGSSKARERHQSQGKMLVRDRLLKLFDDGTLIEDLSLIHISEPTRPY